MHGLADGDRKHKDMCIKDFESIPNNCKLKDDECKLHGFGVTKDLENHATGFMLNQMSAKEGLKKNGEKALSALHDEFLQMFHI